MTSKPAYVKPIHTLVSTQGRVAEQIKGRLLFVHTEQLKSGSEKTIAVMVDKDKKFALKSVLVHEAWNPADQAHMRKFLKPLEGKVVSITNAKIIHKGKSVVFFDSSVKSSWDLNTKVTECAEDNTYPKSLPTLPNLKAVASISQACMVSLVAAVTEEGEAKERAISPTVKKLVANLKMATGDTNMAAAFWEGLAERMGSATLQQVYCLDWVLLKQEGAGKYSLTSVAASMVHLEEGDVATSVTDGLAAPADMVSLSTQYGLTYEDKMKKPFARADLFSLEEVQALQIGTQNVFLVPACYVIEARGMTGECPGRAWYIGCTQCKKQLDEKMQCPQHGMNKGKRVYAGQLLLADPSHKKEFAVWEETLRRVVKNVLGHEDLDLDNIMEHLSQAFKGMELVVRVGVAMRRDGQAVNFDMFDIAQQVTRDGCLALYKEIKHDFGQLCPCIVPACCQSVTINNLGQLAVKTDAMERTVETVKLMVKVVDHPDLKVPDGIDGLEVFLKCECVCCKKQCLLYAAGLPSTVQVYTRMAPDQHMAAFVQTMEEDYKFPVGHHVSLKDSADVAMDGRVFKWQASQVMRSLSLASLPSDMDEKEIQLKRTKSIESLLTDTKPQAKRLRLVNTDDGSSF